MARRPDPGNKFIDAALKLASDKPFADVSLGDIAQSAGAPPGDLYRQFSDKTAIILGYIRRVDETVLLVDRSDDADLSARDRLFDVVMARFEILENDKAALKSIAADVLRDPVALLRLNCGLERSSRWMLQAAAIPNEGPVGHIRRRGLMMVMATLLPVWFRDDTEDLARTMKALDQRLATVERLVSILRRPMQRRETGSSGRQSDGRSETTHGAVT